MSQPIQFLLLAACLFLLYRIVHHVRIALILRRGDILRGRRVLDASPVAETLNDIDALLKGLGFAPIHAIEQRYALQRQATTIFTYRHDMGIYASLAPVAAEPPFTITFISVFADDSMVATTYPHGTQAAKPDLDLKFASYDPTAAFDDHAIRTLRWTESHGEPVLNDDAVSSEADDRRLMARHGRNLFGHVIRKNDGAALSLLVLLAIVGAILWSSLSTAAQTAEISPNVMVASFGLFSDTIVFMAAIFIGIALIVAANIRSEPARRPKPLDIDLKPPEDKRHPLARPPRTR